jgi:hypothetical protein
MLGGNDGGRREGLESEKEWVPAFAGTTRNFAGMTEFGGKVSPLFALLLPSSYEGSISDR